MSDIGTEEISDYNTNELPLKGLKVYKIGNDVDGYPGYSRKDYYKICLITGFIMVKFEDRIFLHDGTILFFGCPNTPYVCEMISTTFSGYACLISLDLLNRNKAYLDKEHYGLLQTGIPQVASLSENQSSDISRVFQEMISGIDGDIYLKNQLIINYIPLIVGKACNMI
jgi:AraC family transcriptional activator of pobA